MPTYDYVCKTCEHGFEHFQGIHEPLLRKCPSCGRRSLQRLIGAGAGVLFRGSGFYETDYKRSGSSGSRPEHGKGGKAKGDASPNEGDGGSKTPDPPARPDSGGGD
jgi:putative FmdB family regulatory protein